MQPRSVGKVSEFCGHVFVAGGYSSTGSAVTNLVQEFDLAKKTVTTAAPLPTARAGLGLTEFFVSAGNELFAIGGIDASGNVLSTVEIYNEATNTWSEGAAMPTPRAFLTVIGAPDGYIYAIGGTGASGKSVATVEKYNPTNNTWSTGPSLNIARSHFGGVLGALDAIYVAGGIDVNGNYLSSSEAYSLILGGSFAVITSMNVARSDFAFDKGADGFLHAAGGHSATGDLRSIEGFNPSTGVWTIEPESFNVGQAELAGAEGINGRDYFIGGTTAKKFVPRVQRGISPFAPSHTETFYMHGYDEPYINGTFTMDDEVPLSGETLGLSLLGTTDWTTFPSVTGTIQSGGTVTVNIPTTLSLGVLTTFTLYSQDFDGGSQVELGQVSQLIGLGLLDTVQIPISTPVTFNDKVLVLSISTVLGLDLNLSGGVVNMQITGLDGEPSN
jgi:Kelch motif